MATYKLVNADQLDSDLTAVGNAIRSKGGTSAGLSFPAGMVSAIGAISTGVELNFDVVGGTSQPSNPKENMIWVNTSTKITSYIFSATKPTGSAGMVWISTGTSSPVEFNALRKNGIQVYPISAKQYISGKWVDKTALSYQNGKWVDWFTYIVKDGASLVAFNSDLRSNHMTTLTKMSEYLKVVLSDSRTGGPVTNDKIDITNVKTIYLDVDVKAIALDGVSVGIFSAKGLNSGTEIRNAAVAQQLTNKTGRQVLKCEVEQYSGKYYIGMFSDDTDAVSGYAREYHIYGLYYA